MNGGAERSSSHLWTHPAFERVAAAVRERAGLVFPENRVTSAESGIRRAMATLGVADAASYAEIVRAGGPAFDDLMSELTIGETYFFRERPQLEYIRNHVLPSLGEQRHAERPLRAWSAGCASGEEPYSLAMMLREEGWESRSHILGTDVSRPRLAAARRGEYTRWSMRGVAPDVVDRYFEHRGTRLALDAAIRRMVSFRHLNLVEGGWPAAEKGTGGMDIILCRNVLIYFDRETIADVARRLVAALDDDGWLFLGASDPMISELAPVDVVVTGAGLAYRRTSRAGAGAARRLTVRESLFVVPPSDRHVDIPTAIEGSTFTPDAPPPVEPLRALPPPLPEAHVAPSRVPDEIAQAYRERDYDRAVALATRDVETGTGDPAVWVLLVRALANQGRLEEAGHACAAALDRHRASAELLHLHALLLAEGRRPAEAAAAARRALYLDRTMIVAHLVLGAALARLGERAGARRAYANALALAERMSPDEIVSGSDGETAHRIVQLARSQMKHLTGDWQ